MKEASETLRTTLRRKADCPYLLYTPKGYRKSRKTGYPLLLFLHGAGERGDDLKLVRGDGPLGRIEEGKELPFITVAPQCRKEEWWECEVLNALLDELVARHNVDEDRVYITGLSMGGQGTWMMLNAYPHRFAAAAPICGPLTRTRIVERFAHIPIWVFHGAMDDCVSIQDSIIMVKSLRGVGGKPRFTVYPDAGHDSWTETYRNPELYTWFLKHKRKP